VTVTKFSCRNFFWHNLIESVSWLQCDGLSIHC
jgi:hypothetical protein